MLYSETVRMGLRLQPPVGNSSTRSDSKTHVFSANLEVCGSKAMS